MGKRREEKRMKPITAFFYLSTLCLFFVPNQATTVSEIERACNFTSHQELCLSTLGADPNNVRLDLNGLTMVALRIASENATAITEYIHRSSDNQTLEPAIQQGLSDCLENYVDSSDQLDSSLASFSAKAFNDVNTFVKAAVAAATSCEAAFNGQVTETSHKSRVFRQLCNNALAILKGSTGI